MLKKMVVLFLFCWAGKTGFAQEKLIQADRFLRESVTLGLQKDRFPQDIARKIVENSERFFVTKCPICTPVKNSFAEYARKIPNKTRKTKTPKNLLNGLASEDKTTQQTALRDLVERYAQQGFAKLKDSPEAIEKLKQDLEEKRKTGMQRKSEKFGTFCPSCDGACKPK